MARVPQEPEPMERTPKEFLLFGMTYYGIPFCTLGLITGKWWLIAIGLTMSATGLTCWLLRSR